MKGIRSISLAAAIAAAMLLAAQRPAAAKPPTCDPAKVQAAATAIGDACPCAGKTDPATGAVVPWKNHGKYVSCVAKATAQQTGPKAGLARYCMRTTVRCAARSVCGKADRVACVTTTAGTCTGDPTPGDGTAAGTCDGSGAPCDTDADCSTQSCQKATAEACSTAGGSPADSGSCCGF
jgi:hypothetical protein